jgi:hypothetical protein
LQKNSFFLENVEAIVGKSTTYSCSVFTYKTLVSAPAALQRELEKNKTMQ